MIGGEFEMKNYIKKSLKASNGITLIALVITIIVLLILAGISISMLSGDNSILSKAGEARDRTGERAIAERVQIAYLGALAEGKGEATEEGLTTALNSEFGSGNYTLAQDLSKVTIDGKDYSFDWTVTPGGGENPGGGETQTVSDLRTASISNGVTALSDTGTTTIKDNKDNEIKVPKGFGIATDSGINAAEGIVIEDATHEGTTKGSQFVWVPVGTITKTDGSTEAITLGRYSFGTDGTPSAYSGSYTEDSATSHNASYGNTIAKDIAGFISSANSNKGYYIGRYEAGINASTDQYAYANCSGSGTSLSYGDSSKMFAKDGRVKPLSIKGKGIWNAVTQLEAATIAGSMYNTSTDKVTSDLINSYAWDTAILFIQKCGNNGDDSSKYSIQRGYSAISTSERATAGNNKLAYQPGGTAARETAIFDTQCKICDMAGNVREWTTETYSNTSYPCVGRGGAYNDPALLPITLGFTALRSFYYTTDAYDSLGFRPLLYL